MTRIAAHRDPALRARIVRKVPLVYAAGADPALDRPAHVRAGSGLAWIGGVLAVMQDDANFIALADPVTGLVAAVGAFRALESGGGVLVDVALARSAAGAAARLGLVA